jgi:hypothetical protein
MIPVLHITLLATPKIKLFRGLLPIFVAHQPTHQPKLLWAKLNFTLRKLSFCGHSITQILLRGPLTILGAHWVLFVFRESKSNFNLVGFFFWVVSQTQISDPNKTQSNYKWIYPAAPNTCSRTACHTMQHATRHITTLHFNPLSVV